VSIWLDRWEKRAKGTTQKQIWGNRFFQDESRKGQAINYVIELLPKTFHRYKEVENLFEVYLRWEYDIQYNLKRRFKD